MALRYLIIALAVGFLFVFAVTGYTIFAMAGANGGTITVAIDHFGEMYLELVVVHLIVIPTISTGMAFLVDELAAA